MSYTPPVNKSVKPVVTTGFTYTVPDGITIVTLNSSILLLTGTVTMPANPTDAMPLNIQSNKGITALTLQANTGQAFAATPVAVMAANSPVKFKYSMIDATWYPN